MFFSNIYVRFLYGFYPYNIWEQYGCGLMGRDLNSALEGEFLGAPARSPKEGARARGMLEYAIVNIKTGELVDHDIWAGNIPTRAIFTPSTMLPTIVRETLDLNDIVLPKNVYTMELAEKEILVIWGGDC